MVALARGAGEVGVAHRHLGVDVAGRGGLLAEGEAACGRCGSAISIWPRAHFDLGKPICRGAREGRFGLGLVRRAAGAALVAHADQVHGVGAPGRGLLLVGAAPRGVLGDLSLPKMYRTPA